MDNLLYVLFFSLMISGFESATPNADDKYQTWPDPGRILYQLSQDFDIEDFQVLQKAMEQTAIDSGQCVKFQRYDPRADNGKDYLYISSRLADKRSLPMCYTFPGRSTEQKGRGQYMVMFSSRTAPESSSTATIPGACLDNVRDAMKFLFHSLGFRSEYGRTDRVNYIDFANQQNPDDLVAKNLYDLKPFKLYQPGEASFYNLFDPTSITMIDGKKWARSAMNPVFVPKSNVWIGGKPNLSQQDCQALASTYNCDTMKCQNPYHTLASGGITLVATNNNPMDAQGLCYFGQRIEIGSVTAGGLQGAQVFPQPQQQTSQQQLLPGLFPQTSQGVFAGGNSSISSSSSFNSNSNSNLISGSVIGGQPVNPSPNNPMPMNLMPLERAGASPYVFSIVGSNPMNFQILPDNFDQSKANIVLNSVKRSFTNAQITIQVSNAANQNQLAQLIVAVNLNCAPLFTSFPPGSPGTMPAPAPRMTLSPIKGVICSGNLLNTPMIIGAFTAIDPDNEPLIYYLTMSKKFQISSGGVLILIEAPTSDLANVPLDINALDSNGAVATLHLTVPFIC